MILLPSTAALTPIERRGRVWLKRDDLFEINGATGGKARATLVLAHGARGLVGVGARTSAQIARVARVAEALGIPARVHTAAGSGPSASIDAAYRAGAQVITHRPGYMNVLRARARDDALDLGYRLIPFGAISQEAVLLTQDQCRDLPPCRRIVLPVGSGITASGALRALDGQVGAPRLLGVRVGQNPAPNLDRFAPPWWRQNMDLVISPYRYDEPASPATFEGLRLDATYEAKCLPYLKEDDLLWIVGGPIA